MPQFTERQLVVIHTVARYKQRGFVKGNLPHKTALILCKRGFLERVVGPPAWLPTDPYAGFKLTPKGEEILMQIKEIPVLLPDCPELFY